MNVETRITARRFGEEPQVFTHKAFTVESAVEQLLAGLKNDPGWIVMKIELVNTAGIVPQGC